MSHAPVVARALIPLAALALACSGGAPEQDEDVRDLTMAPAESVSVLNDAPQPEPEPVAQPELPPPEPRPRPRTQQPTPPPSPAPEPEPMPEPPPPPAGLEAGTAFTIYAADTISSKNHEVGAPIMAMLTEDITDLRGEVVLPAGAVFLGTISDMSAGDGRVVLTFNRVEFGGVSYAVQGRVDSVGVRMQGQGVNAGDAAKVGAGAVVGAIAGRILGGNKKGTIVGAAAGAAAGAGVAAATKGEDLFVDAGSPIRIVLTAPFVPEPLRTS